MGFRFCNAVHTVGMHFPIDIAFVDRHGRLLRLYQNVPPGRWCVWGGFKAWTVYERDSRRGVESPRSVASRHGVESLHGQVGR